MLCFEAAVEWLLKFVVAVYLKINLSFLLKGNRTMNLVPFRPLAEFFC